MVILLANPANAHQILRFFPPSFFLTIPYGQRTDYGGISPLGPQQPWQSLLSSRTYGGGHPLIFQHWFQVRIYHYLFNNEADFRSLPSYRTLYIRAFYY
jgi:hypothetical protein